MSDYRIVSRCPCNLEVAPYFAIILHDAGASADSIYRGDDARWLLNRYGKHSQKQLCLASPAQRRAWGILGTPNHWGQSTHELRSDGVAYRRRVGAPLPWWCQGIDVPDAYVARVMRVAARHHWPMFRPYRAGVEYHHLNFVHRPTPHGRDRVRVHVVRARLPRK